ncbi:MAG: hypothetical protein ACXAE3_08715 [Candidatus Kariarchaeaceae archaeon]
MVFYRPISLLALVGMSTASIYFFIQDQDILAKQLAFLGLYSFLTLFYFLKSLYYRRHKATFNEIFFVVGIPLIPPLLAIVGQLTEINSLFEVGVYAEITVSEQIWQLQLSLASLLALPFYLFALYLLLRTFIRYEFLRWTAHSSGGLPGTLTGLIMSVMVGTIYLVVAILFGDLMLVIFGFVYTITGLLSFFA